MKIKNGALELLETKQQALTNLFEADDIPIEASFRFAEFAYKLKDPVKIYIKEKDKLVKRYANKDKTGKPLIQDGQYFVTEHREKYLEEYQTLINMEIDIEKPTIQLGQWAQGKVTTKDIRDLFELIHFTFQGDS